MSDNRGLYFLRRQLVTSGSVLQFLTSRLWNSFDEKRKKNNLKQTKVSFLSDPSFVSSGRSLYHYSSYFTACTCTKTKSEIFTGKRFGQNKFCRKRLKHNV